MTRSTVNINNLSKTTQQKKVLEFQLEIQHFFGFGFHSDDDGTPYPLSAANTGIVPHDGAIFL